MGPVCSVHKHQLQISSSATQHHFNRSLATRVSPVEDGTPVGTGTNTDSVSKCVRRTVLETVLKVWVESVLERKKEASGGWAQVTERGCRWPGPAARWLALRQRPGKGRKMIPQTFSGTHTCK